MALGVNTLGEGSWADQGKLNPEIPSRFDLYISPFTAALHYKYLFRCLHSSQTQISPRIVILGFPVPGTW